MYKFKNDLFHRFYRQTSLRAHYYNSSFKTLNEWNLPEVAVVVDVGIDRIEHGAENDNTSE